MALQARYRQILLYSISMALLLFFLKWLELRFVIIDHALELYVGAVAVVFTGLGIWLALKVVRPKVKVIEREVYVNGTHPVLNEKTRADLNLSKRELEVLQLMADGLSNKEIADRLFVSLSTVKTHSNNLFDKMNVERRTQAIDNARRLGIIL